jgi:outer membrane protein W
MFSLIPIGVNWHTKSGVIRPYAYVGVGLTLLVMTDYQISNYKYVGDSNSFVPLPGINIGAGAKIKVGSKFILLEITPTYWAGLYLNIGFSF